MKSGVGFESNSVSKLIIVMTLDYVEITRYTNKKRLARVILNIIEITIIVRTHINSVEVYSCEFLDDSTKDDWCTLSPITSQLWWRSSQGTSASTGYRAAG